MAIRMWRCDFHVHTALSPCAADDMTPRGVVAAARARRLDAIAVTDHNSVRQVRAVVDAAKRFGITVIPGMEVRTREDVHLVCLFDTVEQAEAWGEVVYENLPPLANREAVYGCQLLFDGSDQPVGREERLLLTACDLSVEQVVTGVRKLGGLVIPAHVDRQAYGLLTILGLFPPDLELRVAEVAGGEEAVAALRRFPYSGGVCFYAASDAHRLEEIGIHPTCFYLKEVSVAELGMAFRGMRGRKVVMCPNGRAGQGRHSRMVRRGDRVEAED